MKADGWWRDALLEWADTTGFSVELAAYGKPQTKRELGEWWLNGGHWHLHLDPFFYARLSPEPELTVRRTLTWTLSLLRQTQRPTTEMLLTSWFESLLEVPSAALDKLVIGESLLDPPETSWIEKYGSGWLCLLTPQYPKTVTLEERAELRQNIRQVIGSFAEDGFIGWIHVNRTSEQALVFISNDALTQTEWGEDEDSENSDWTSQNGTDEVSLLGGNNGNRQRRIASLRQFAQNLLDSLSQDALIQCHMAIGAQLENAAELSNGLLTLALLWRKRHLLESPGRVLLWGEHPLDILLQTVPGRGVEWFLQATGYGGNAHTDVEVKSALSDELMTSLEGLVAANLNVSEAARLLFVHRNTLIHRLDKIRELTGYDVRNFRDALVLWLSHSLQISTGDSRFRRD